MNDNMMAMPNFPLDSSPQSIEHLYPEAYRHMYPFIANAIDGYVRRRGDVDITEDDIERMTNDVINQSGIELDNDMEPEAIPVQRGFGRGRRRHSRNSLADIARILLLRELFDRRKRRNVPFVMFPYTYY